MDPEIQKLIDENAVRNLVATLAHRADHDEDMTEYYKLWTEDGVYDVYEEIGWKPGMPSKAKKVAGMAALKKDRDMLRGTGFQGPGTDVWHANTTLSVKIIDDKTAEAKSYWMLVHGHGKCDVVRIGYYNDTFRKTPEGWKISYRIVIPNGGGPSPDPSKMKK
jgi:hypothetical protein